MMEKKAKIFKKGEEKDKEIERIRQEKLLRTLDSDAQVKRAQGDEKQKIKDVQKELEEKFKSKKPTNARKAFDDLFINPDPKEKK